MAKGVRLGSNQAVSIGDVLTLRSVNVAGIPSTVTASAQSGLAAKKGFPSIDGTGTSPYGISTEAFPG